MIELPKSPINNLPHYNARKTHCKRGHTYDADNTYLKPRSGARNCQKCRALSRNNWIIKKAKELLNA